MKPHIEEAWRSLRLADRDITAFNILKEEPEAHVSIVNFHAQQAVEKSLKAVLYSQQIEFERTHDLAKLARLLGERGITLPASSDEFRLLNRGQCSRRRCRWRLPSARWVRRRSGRS